MSTTTIFNALLVIGLTLLVVSPGCRLHNSDPARQAAAVPRGPVLNPLPVPFLARELVMDEISDEIDNYLPIMKEEGIRDVDGILSEGWIETRPTIGSSIFEPWKKDSTKGFERIQSTLQTIRRFAKVRVIPTGENYLVDLRVYKELEYLPQPVGSAIGGRHLRHDSALDIDRNEIFDVKSSGWIPQGRDFSLEQEILQNIHNRFLEVTRQANAASCESAQ